jgi:hypothetical protein
VFVVVAVPEIDRASARRHRPWRVCLELAVAECRGRYAIRAWRPGDPGVPGGRIRAMWRAIGAAPGF